ncbi:MAG: hypothetical protein QM796_00845 [Chthoniobacteraceae bacterium]
MNRRLPVGRILLCAIVSMAAFAGTAAALHAWLPVRVPTVEGKLRDCDLHRAEINTIFLGSSRFDHGIVPDLFDNVAYEDGVVTCSYNFGVDGMKSGECLYLLKTILALRLPHLQRVFIEDLRCETGINPNEKGTLHERYWHGPEETWWSLRAIIAGTHLSRAGLWASVSTMADHLQISAADNLNVGSGLSWLVPRTGQPGAARLATKEFTEAGFVPLLGSEPKPGQFQALNKAVAALRKNPEALSVTDQVSVAMLDEMIRLVRKAGLEPVLVQMPTPYELPQLSDPRLIGVPVYRFSDVVRYPAFYLATNRHNLDHFNIEGARNFTETLAEQFALQDDGFR